jgi:hypothetical protein
MTRDICLQFYRNPEAPLPDSSEYKQYKDQIDQLVRDVVGLQIEGLIAGSVPITDKGIPNQPLLSVYVRDSERLEKVVQELNRPAFDYAADR